MMSLCQPAPMLSYSPLRCANTLSIRRSDVLKTPHPSHVEWDSDRKAFGPWLIVGEWRVIGGLGLELCQGCMLLHVIILILIYYYIIIP